MEVCISCNNNATILAEAVSNFYVERHLPQPDRYVYAFILKSLRTGGWQTKEQVLNDAVNAVSFC